MSPFRAVQSATVDLTPAFIKGDPRAVYSRPRFFFISDGNAKAAPVFLRSF